MTGQTTPVAGAGEAGSKLRTALVSVTAAALLVALKLGTGLLTGSLGLISACVETSGDVVAGVPEGDAVAALVVAAIIFVAVVRLVGENAAALMDRAPVQARTAAEDALGRLRPDVEVRRLRLRESAGQVFADVTVALPPATA